MWNWERQLAGLLLLAGVAAKGLGGSDVLVGALLIFALAALVDAGSKTRRAHKKSDLVEALEEAGLAKPQERLP